MDKASAISILNSLTVVETSGAVTAKVSNINHYVREDGMSGFIVSYNLMNLFGATKAQQLLAEGDLQEACNQNLTSFQRDGKDWCPVKDEHVKVNIGEVSTRDGKIALLPISVIPMPAAKISKVSFGGPSGPKEAEVVEPEEAKQAK